LFSSLAFITESSNDIWCYSWLNLFSFYTERITALELPNAKDAILPLTKLHTQEKKGKHGATKPCGECWDSIVGANEL
jgi:hypothetical protein